MSKYVLELSKVTRTFFQGQKKLEVLKGVTFKLEAGKTAALVGPSGSGKTTLLHICGLLEAPDSGVLKIEGHDLSKVSDTHRTLLRNQKIGFVFQFHHLLPEFTALENVAMPVMIAGKSKKAAEEKAAILLKKVGLKDRMAHRPAQLSGGEQQRVAIARALVNDPTLLLADEPTGNLDPATAARVFDVFKSLVKDLSMTALIATHDQTLAKKLDGKLKLDGGQVH